MSPSVGTISADLAKMKQYICVLVFLAETGEAQVSVMCDLCRKWRRHHRRLQWEHPGVGKRHVNSFIPSTFIYTEWSKEKLTLFCTGATCALDNTSKNLTI